MADLMQNGIDATSRRESNCVRCRNHGLKVILRGHKQYCPYAACMCDKCRFTAEQQRQMRLQNAIRRAEVTDRSPNSGVSVAKRARELSSPSSSMGTPQHQQSPQMSSPQQQVVTVTVQSAPQAQITMTNGISDEKKILFDCSSELLKKFRYPWEMMPVMFALAKYANGNMEEVLQKIDEGQNAVNEQVRLQTLNLYFQQQQQQQNNNSNVASATRECG